MKTTTSTAVWLFLGQSRLSPDESVFCSVAIPLDKRPRGVCGRVSLSPPFTDNVDYFWKSSRSVINIINAGIKQVAPFVSVCVCVCVTWIFLFLFFAEHNNFSDSALLAPGIMRELKNAGKIDGVTFIDQVCVVRY